ncbi:MAG TPA: M15 family metallopeptidase [Thermoanaerobaculia bacterium]|nr:M15 family metallopeptidase [Thermoanaerobaculia bacterium]
MAVAMSREEVLFLQRLLKVQGLYTGPLNGSWGTQTDEAVTESEARANQLAARLGTFDNRSEQNIRTLHLQAQEAARVFLGAFANAEYTVRIISGNRTYAEQDAIYAQGRTTPGKIVTNAKGGQSNHNFAIAWDIGIFVKGKYLPESPFYKAAATVALAATVGVEWGGHWKKPDRPHYQLATGKTIKEVQELFESGKPYLPG